MLLITIPYLQSTTIQEKFKRGVGLVFAFVLGTRLDYPFKNLKSVFPINIYTNTNIYIKATHIINFPYMPFLKY